MDSKFWSWTAEMRSLADLTVPEMAALNAYWQKLAGGEIPDQRDIRFADIAPLASNIALLTVRQKPFRAKYRLVGHALVKLLGSDPTGRYVHEVFGSSVSDDVYGCFADCIDRRAPVYFKREFQILGRSFGYHRLVLPLRFGGETVERLLLCIFPTNKNLKDARKWKPLVAEMARIEDAAHRFGTGWMDSLSDEDQLEP